MNREAVSAFVICFNEEDTIADCLKSLAFCDEVLVVDSFSTDRTVEIAESLGAQVIQRKWSGYRDQKAFGLSAVKNEWVINLDADERISEELRSNIIAVLEKEFKSNRTGERLTNDKQIVGYYMNRVVYYLGRWWRSGGWYPEYRLRFFKRSHVTWGGVEPHEKPIVNGETATLAGEIQHFTYKNMDEQFERLHNFSSIAAEEEFKRGGSASLVSLLFNPLVRTLKFYFIKRGYREGRAGLIVALAEGYYTFMKYAKLWEKEFNAAGVKKGSREDG